MDLWTLRENKRKIIVTVATIITVTILILSFKFFANIRVENELEDKIVIAHAANTKESYTMFVTRGNVILRDNIKSKETVLKYVDYKNIQEAPYFKPNDGISNEYEYFKDSKVIDPVSLGFIEEIPNTYNMPREETSKYIQEMINNDWSREGTFCTKTDCEFFMKKDKELIRLISNGKTLKIILKFSGKIYAPKTYINE